MASRLDVPPAVAAFRVTFRATFPALDAKVLLMADTIYAVHIRPLRAALVALGYACVFPTAVVHDRAPLLLNCRPMWPSAAARWMQQQRLYANMPCSTFARRSHHFGRPWHRGHPSQLLKIRHYLAVLARLQRQICNAGHKSCAAAVSKVNVEKFANSAEIKAWVGVSC